LVSWKLTFHRMYPSYVPSVEHCSRIQLSTKVDLRINKPIALLYDWPIYTNESLKPSEYVKNESEPSIQFVPHII
jgi:hypothetical protein